MIFNPFQEFLQKEKITPISEDKIKPEKKKKSIKEINIFCEKVIEENPKLKEKLTETMKQMSEKNIEMPLIHITSKGIKTETKTIVLDFIANIEKYGLRKRDTNVGAFINRYEQDRLAKPDDYISKPEEFIKSIRLFLEEYGYHGRRTNKEILKELRESGEGIPVMILIDGTDIELEKGSDYHDHYKLSEGAAPEKIMGVIDLQGKMGVRDKASVVYIASEILRLINESMK